MKWSVYSSVSVLVIIILLIASRPVSAAGKYWFQVGVFMQGNDYQGSQTVTGASIQIKTHVEPYDPQGNTPVDTSYWIGLNLPNDGFIQVGYVSWSQNGGYPQRFWEYYPPTTASQGGGVFHGDFEGDQVGPDGRWYTYSIQSDGDTWNAYVNGVTEGSYNFGVSDSGGNTPYAFAEVEGAYSTNIALGPVEFRNLAYRDTNHVWHNASEGYAWMGYGAGSAALPQSVPFQYGLQVLGVNDWVAGSGLPLTYNATMIWNGSTVVPEFPTAPILPLVLCLALALVVVQRKFPKIH